MTWLLATRAHAQITEIKQIKLEPGSRKILSQDSISFDIIARKYENPFMSDCLNKSRQYNNRPFHLVIATRALSFTGLASTLLPRLSYAYSVTQPHVEVL